MYSIHGIFAVFFFCVYSIGVFYFGFVTGYDQAIDDMKKIKSRK